MRTGPLVRTGAAAVAALVLAGCVRLETPEPSWPSPSPAVVERDALAQAHADLAAMVDESGASPLAALESSALPDLIAGIGDAYAAYPDEDEQEPVDDVPTTLDGAAQSALDASLTAAFEATDPDVRAWGASAAIVHALALWIGAGDDGVAERALPGLGADDVLTVPTTSALGADNLADLAQRHDEMRCLLDQIAMRTAGDEQSTATARRDIDAARSDALQSLAGGVDERAAVCSIPLASIADEGARALATRSALTALGNAYAALSVAASAEDLEWLLDGAFDAYAAAATTPGWTTADVPTTPGLSAPDAG